jgi:hypothetical protein
MGRNKEYKMIFYARLVRRQENDILPYQPDIWAWYGDGKTLSIRTKANKLMVRLQENDILLYHPGVGAWYGDRKTLSIRTKAGELMVRRKEIDTLPYHHSDKWRPISGKNPFRFRTALPISRLL